MSLIPVRGAAAALASLSLVACIKELPPPAAPAQVAPAVTWPKKPPSDNQGRVAFDVTAGKPAIVELIEGRNMTASETPDGAVYGVGLMTRRLCTTPCTADLPLGEHEVRLRIKDTYGLGIVPIKVGEQPSAVRVDLGWQDPGHPVERGIGATLFSSGIVMALVGIPLWLTADSSGGSSAASGMTLLGAGMTGLGLYLVIDAGGEIRPTSYNQWDVPTPGRR